MDVAKKKRKKICPRCGKKLWLRDFYRNKKNGVTSSYCKECMKEVKNEEYAAKRKKPDGVLMHGSYGRLMEHDGFSTRIYWSGNMLSVLRRYFPNTKTEEVAEMLGVSRRTVIRKARELGLEKESGFLKKAWDENRLLALAASKRSEKSGFKKGHVPWNKGMKSDKSDNNDYV